MKTAGEREKEDREKDLVRIENGKEIKKERGQTENESI